MRVGTLVGLILIVAGVLGLVLGQVGFTRKREVAEVGPLTVSRSERQTFTVPVVLSGLSIAAGLALVIAVRRAK
jgi:hypothetical protein